LPFYRGNLSVAEAKRGKEERKIIEQLKLHVGDKILIRPLDRKGIIKYIGQVHFTYGYVIGLELLETAHGKHSGEFQSVQYFECSKGRGLFVKVDSIEKVLQVAKTKKKKGKNDNEDNRVVFYGEDENENENKEETNDNENINVALSLLPKKRKRKNSTFEFRNW